jgi:hypothetical protein
MLSLYVFPPSHVRICNYLSSCEVGYGDKTYVYQISLFMHCTLYSLLTTIRQMECKETGRKDYIL